MVVFMAVDTGARYTSMIVTIFFTCLVVSSILVRVCMQTL